MLRAAALVARRADLVDAADEVAAQVLFAAEEQDDALDEVEDELFRFGRILEREPELRSALTDPSLPAERKQSLLDALLEGKVRAGHRVAGRRGRPAPARAHHRPRRSRSTAGSRPPAATGWSPGSRSAVPLTEAQLTRLAERAGCPSWATRCTCNVEIDPDLVGGLTVRVGDELYRRQRRPPARRRPPPDDRLSAAAAPNPRLFTARHRPRRAGTTMTELTIRPDEIRDALERSSRATTPSEADKAEVGRVIETGDGIARVEGLHSTMTNELLDFGDGVLGIALNLDVREIGCVILGDAQHIREGQEVRRTGEILSIPVGDGFLGRVVDPLGRPLDGKGDIESTERRVLETQAPSVVQRQPVKEPLQTGVKAIDAMTAIGRGQRQLIIGDRQTGKTAVALDAIINQRDNWKSGDPTKQVKCVYVAIGQKGTTVREVVNTLEEAGAMEYTTVVSAPAWFPAAFKYLAPYAGSALGQYWMYQGEHALIVFDDLSKQAEAYRAISLLLRRPAGREAYPGDGNSADDSHPGPGQQGLDQRYTSRVAQHLLLVAQCQCHDG